MKHAVVLAAAATLAASGCTARTRVGPPSPTCDPAVLADNLRNAESGTEVLVDACTVVGSFAVRAGVTLRGQGVGLSRIQSEDGAPALVVETSSRATSRLVGLTVAPAGCAGVVIEGGGSASVEDVEVLSALGVGLLADGTGSLSLTRVSLGGPVTVENVGTLGPEPSPDETATFGLVLLQVASASLESVEVAGFALAGALIVESDLGLRGCSLSDNSQLGLFVVGGRAALDDVDLSRTFAGMTLIPVVAGLFAGGADVSSTDLIVEDNQGLGLYHAGGRVSHVDLVVRDNEETAVSAHGCDEVVVTGAGTEIARNGVAGLFVTEAGRTELRGFRVTDTVLTPAIYGETGLIEVGDGLELLRPAGPVELADLELAGSGRVQLLVDLGGDAAVELRVEAVVVDGAGDQLGALLQGAPGHEGWDAELDRRGATEANDGAFEGSLPTLTVPTLEAVDPRDYSREGLLGGCS